MYDISQEYSDDEDITLHNDNMYGLESLWTVLLQSQEEYHDRAGEGPINIDGYNGDGQSVYSSSDNGEGDEVSSVIDLDPELLYRPSR
jgi:hypothetical protein